MHRRKWNTLAFRGRVVSLLGLRPVGSYLSLFSRRSLVYSICCVELLLDLFHIRIIASAQDIMKAISARTAIPILTGMKTEANTYRITLTGSDSDISIESYTFSVGRVAANVSDGTSSAQSQSQSLQKEPK